MLLLDKNAEPKKTIFYISAIVHGLILKKIVNIESLYIELQKEIEDELNYDFFYFSTRFSFSIR
ncbi:ABC-three component system middle component 6 [Streptococcus pneumoniae]|uniref:ABC-three component system middle component 6 n=1 Tax=Streptococcus pneumoniae TaxID=1313 RepID=UPI000B66DC96|nr:ABC-three component system middle component 6 [Streptococcus pneumoniae]SNJ74640.1 Uncharacterised protein [Streptococcus pneumoniae]SNJ89109.1 Uncharacterised protein [Streptococcus pneumoniae]